MWRDSSPTSLKGEILKEPARRYPTQVCCHPYPCSPSVLVSLGRIMNASPSQVHHQAPQALRRTRLTHQNPLMPLPHRQRLLLPTHSRSSLGHKWSDHLSSQHTTQTHSHTHAYALILSSFLNTICTQSYIERPPRTLFASNSWRQAFPESPAFGTTCPHSGDLAPVLTNITQRMSVLKEPHNE